MLVAAVNACGGGCRHARAPALLTTATIAAALAGALLYGHWRLSQTFDDGQAVQVAVQGGPPPPVRAQRPRAWRAMPN
jgi:hypothetical protein